MQSKNNIPASLLKTISEELTRMLTRSLDNAPAGDEIHFSVDVMANDLYSLGYDENYIDRIEDAFNFFGQHADRWPTTKDIMETIKARRPIFVSDQKAIEEKKEEWKPVTEGVPTPAGILAEKIRKTIIQPKLTKRQIKTINDEDNERLSKEDSVEGIIYRHTMRI